MKLLVSYHIVSYHIVSYHIISYLSPNYIYHQVRRILMWIQWDILIYYTTVPNNHGGGYDGDVEIS